MPVDPTDCVTIQLSRSEALILFEWLAKHDASGDSMALGPAEQQVLWKVEGQLEKTLDEVLLPDYQARVIAARKSILGKEDPDDETT